MQYLIFVIKGGLCFKHYIIKIHLHTAYSPFTEEEIMMLYICIAVLFGTFF